MPDVPARIQLSRAKGWRKPEGALIVSRPSPWGNPWKAEVVQGVGWVCTDTRSNLIVQARDRRDAHDLAVAHYRTWIAPRAEAARAELRGRALCCWCPLDMPCHAAVLIEIANAPLTCEAV